LLDHEGARRSIRDAAATWEGAEAQRVETKPKYQDEENKEFDPTHRSSCLKVGGNLGDGLDDLLIQPTLLPEEKDNPQTVPSPTGRGCRKRR
jgi:hypothetical protein